MKLKNQCLKIKFNSIQKTINQQYNIINEK